MIQDFTPLKRNYNNIDVEIRQGSRTALTIFHTEAPSSRWCCFLSGLVLRLVLHISGLAVHWNTLLCFKLLRRAAGRRLEQRPASPSVTPEVGDLETGGVGCRVSRSAESVRRCQRSRPVSPSGLASGACALVTSAVERVTTTCPR